MTTADPAAAPRRMGRPPLDPEERARRAEAKAEAKAARRAEAKAARRASGVATHPLAALAGRVPDHLLAVVIGVCDTSIRNLRKRAGLPSPSWARHFHDLEARRAILSALEPGGVCAARADAAAPILRRQWGL